MAESPDINILNKFDVIKFAKDIISEVESVRSYRTVTDEDTKQSYNIPIESRINAFFRLVGLPTFVTLESKGDKDTEGGPLAGDRHLTPGFFGAKLDQYVIKNMENLGDIENLSIIELEAGLAAREKELGKIENSIGSDESNKNMAKALRSCIPIVPNIPKDDVKPGKVTSVGGTFDRIVFKRLFPLITSYIDVVPKRNEVARPFVVNETLQQIDNQTPLARPFIETVARIRLVSGSNALDANEKTKNEDVSAAVKNSVGEDSYKEISNDDKDVFESLRSAGTLETFVVLKLFESIFQLANKWYVLQKKQEVYFKKIPYLVSVKTTSAKSSMFGKRASVSTDVSLDEKQELAKKYKKINVLIAREEALQTLLPSNDVIQRTNSKTANNRSTSLGALINPFINLLSYNLEQLKKQRKRVENDIKKTVQEVDKLRVELEIMTGEFTGLSMLDVVAVICALFIVENRYLIALLDKEVKDDMKTDPVLKSAIESAGDPEGMDKALEAVQKLEVIVSFIFNLFNAINKSIVDRNNRTKKTTKNRQKKGESKKNLKNDTTMGMKTSDTDGG
jgi:hypothetical protein